MFLRPRHIVKLTNLSKSTVIRALQSGQLKGRKHQGRHFSRGSWLIKVDDYNEWVDSFSQNVNNVTNKKQ